MGRYLNPGIRKFQMSLNSQIYVDKSSLIRAYSETLFALVLV